MKTGKWVAAMEASRSWLVNSIGNRALREAMRKHARGNLVDIGCGTKPMRKFASGLVKRHIGIDHPRGLHGAENVDVHTTAYRTPFRDGAFDSAICTAVLEHLEEPLEALEECARLLRPGGFAIYTVPFIWHLHEEPRDFFRFSKYGLIHLFEKAGFASIEVRALSGFWVTFGQLLVYNLFRFNRGPMRFLPLIPALGMVLQVVFLALDRLDRTERWTWAYLVLARKTG